MIEKSKKDKKPPTAKDAIETSHQVYTAAMLLNLIEKAISEDSKMKEIHELLKGHQAEFFSLSNRLNAHFLKSLSDEIHSLSVSYKALEHQNSKIIDRLTKIEEKKWWKYWT